MSIKLKPIDCLYNNFSLSFIPCDFKTVFIFDHMFNISEDWKKEDEAVADFDDTRFIFY